MNISTVIMKMIMYFQKISFGKGLKVKGLFLCYKAGQAQLKIGNDFHVNSSPFSSLIGVYQRVIIVARKNGNIQIGDNVGITGGTIHGTNIRIGNNVMIGGNTKIIDHDFHSLDYIDRRTNDVTNEQSRPVIIGDDVFIGCNSLILKGTVIGNRCIVGAGSVVSGTFPEDVVIAGNPAKIIKRIT